MMENSRLFGARPEAEEEAPQFVSPEMQAYLAPPTKDPTLVEVEASTSPV